LRLLARVAALLAIMATLIISPAALANETSDEEIQVFEKPIVFAIDCPTVGGWETVSVVCKMQSTSGLPETHHVRAFYRDQSGTVREIRRAAQDVTALPEEMINSSCPYAFEYKGYDRQIRTVRGVKRMVWVCEPYLSKNSEYYLWLVDENGTKSEETKFKT
jgi:hypothetical protein